jgi:gas vesicle protein
MGTGKAFLGVLAGVAAGALLGILLAPEKGSRTRRRILDKSGEYADDLKSKFEDFYSFVTGKLESTKKSAEQLAEKGKAKYDEAKGSLENQGSEVEHAVPSPNNL